MLSVAMGLTSFALYGAMDKPMRLQYTKGLRRFMLSSVHHDREGRLLEVAARALMIVLVTIPIPEDYEVRRGFAGRWRTPGGFVKLTLFEVW
jgi:hypothetical protein